MEKKMKRSRKTESLPLDLEYNILSRLSMKQLYRFKCVSKHWRDLIRSKDFINLHRQQHASHNSEGTILLISRIMGSILSYDFHANILTNLTSYASNVPGLVKGQRYKRLIGSCNGLLCYEDSHELVFLYNPLTGACKKITHFDRTTSLGIHLVGFGYDRFSDDYKLLSIYKCCEPHTFTLKEKGACIYSFKAKSWKVIKNDLMCCGLHISSAYRFWGNDRTMALVNNVLHWLICCFSGNNYCCDTKCAIASFDIQTEEYRKIQAPDGMDSPNSESILLNLSASENCLHILHLNKKSFQMDVWVMKEYGVEQSWTRLFHCSLLIDQHQVIAGIPFLCAYSEDKQEILVALVGVTDTFLRCNLQRQEFSIVQFLSSDQKYFSTLPWRGVLGSPIDD